MNTVALSGTLTETPSARESKAGKPYVTFSICAADGFRKDVKHIFSCVAFAKAAETLKDLPAGTIVGLSGKLQTRKFSAQGGQERTVVEVFANEAEVILKARPMSNERYEPRDEDDPWREQ